MHPQKLAYFWFRRDLRLHDNVGLWHALQTGLPVQPLFIFDSEILERLPSKADKRVQFIYDEVKRLKLELEKLGSSLIVKIGRPVDVWQELLPSGEIAGVFANKDYEPYGISRDKEVSNLALRSGVEFKLYKDHVIFEQDEIVKGDGQPYLVYTPYMRKWKQKLRETGFPERFDTESSFKNLHAISPTYYPELGEIGFKPCESNIPARNFVSQIIENYETSRDFPAIEGTSKLSVHLRFGTISIRDLTRFALAKNEKYLNELIWREFYMMILYHFPESVSKAIKPAYDRIEWTNNEDHFLAWCDGKTGIPIVDAGMRELNATGFMHNRVRMIVASFLVKHLLIDWRWGEAYFAEKLLDYEQSSNVGGWQWAAGSGCDAAPYFRIFNPITQQQKFDANFEYIKKWVPEFNSPAYAKPIVDLKFGRERALTRFKNALNS